MALAARQPEIALPPGGVPAPAAPEAAPGALGAEDAVTSPVNRRQTVAALRRALASTAPQAPAVAAATPPPPPAREAAPRTAAHLAAQLAGRLVELSSPTGAGVLTWAVRLVAALQQAGRRHGARPVAWVTPLAESFYPPDAAANGVELAALAVVRVPEAAVARAAERLTRSGGFAAVVLDLTTHGRARHGSPARHPLPVPAALQGRLAQQALHHDTAVLCLTEKPERMASLGTLVSLRALTARQRTGESAPPGAEPVAPFACPLQVSKDKRRGPGAGYEEACHGPPGLR